MKRPSRATRRPFTLIVCTACAADVSAEVLDALRTTIRRCGHGVLVTTGCLRGADACGASRTARRVSLALQPCTLDRRPVGRVTWLGPVRRPSDVRALCNWLERGDWEAPVPGVWWDAEAHAVSRN